MVRHLTKNFRFMGNWRLTAVRPVNKLTKIGIDMLDFAGDMSTIAVDSASNA